MASDWPWDSSLDALVAAPAQHRLVFENEHVRVLEARIAPGERTPVHTHCWPAAHYVISWSDFVRRDAAGAVLVDTRTAGMQSVRFRRDSGAMLSVPIHSRTWAPSRCISSAPK